MSKHAISAKEVNNWRIHFKLDNQKVFEELEDYLSIEEQEGFTKQVNRGKLAELYLQKVLGLHPVFDKVQSYDFVYNYQKCQFKYLGQNSSPSISELKRLDEEGNLKFANRVLKFYQECEVFVISLENYISHINWDNCIILTPKEFRKIIIEQAKAVKPGNKMRLRKTLVRKVLREKLGR